MKIRDIAKWTDFVLSLRETVGEIQNLLKEHGNEFEAMHKQNLLLLDRLSHSYSTIEKLEQRIERMESYIMVNNNKAAQLLDVLQIEKPRQKNKKK